MRSLFPSVFLILCLVTFLVPDSGPAFQTPGDILDQHDPTVDGAAAQIQDSSQKPLIPQAAGKPQGTDLAFETMAKILEQMVGMFADIVKELQKYAQEQQKKQKEPAQKAEQQAKKYTVKSGDSLWAIAERFLGDGARYMEIVQANKAKYPSMAKNANLIHPGWVLTIPGGKGGDTVATKPKGPKGGSDNGGSNNGGNDDSSGGKAGSDVAQRVADVAKTFPNKYSRSGSFPYAPGTENGNLGCANVVSKALKEAGVNVWSLNVTGVKNALLGLKAPNNWKVVHPPPWQPGDVVCWSAPSGSIHGHIGIVVKNGNSYSAMNNSSSQRKPIFSTPPNYRAVSAVVRKA